MVNAVAIPDVYTRPYEMVVVTWEVSAPCPYEDYWVEPYVDTVTLEEVPGWVSYGSYGAYYDTGYKEKASRYYTFVATCYCQDQFGVDWYRSYEARGAAQAEGRGDISLVTFGGEDLAGFVWFPVSPDDRYCWLTETFGGYWAERYVEYFQMWDAWLTPLWDPIEFQEYRSDYPIDPCDYGPPDIPRGNGWGIIRDEHAIPHDNCCDVCPCAVDFDADWYGRVVWMPGDKWLFSQSWYQTCFSHSVWLRWLL
jgi:hypothetical protein